jgi:hypothetical protein
MGSVILILVAAPYVLGVLLLLDLRPSSNTGVWLKHLLCLKRAGTLRQLGGRIPTQHWRSSEIKVPVRAASSTSRNLRGILALDHLLRQKRSAAWRKWRTPLDAS